MISCNDLACPKCGGELKHYDRVKRIVRTKGGATSYVEIRRLRCSKCKALHRELPDYILPYKHYELEVVLGVIERLITPDTLGYEDYPCEITMIRWMSKSSNIIHSCCFYRL